MKGSNLLKAVNMAGLVLSATLLLGGSDSAAKDLDNVTQNWDKNIPSASRFTVLAEFSNAAVRDNNTGLVWEQAPNASTRPWGSGSNSANYYCINKNVGGTRGWRLPSVAELVSLIDPSLPPPFVPASVFTGVQSVGLYWSASTVADNTAFAWVVFFFDGLVVPDTKAITLTGRVWCMRGPMNADQY